MERIKNVLIYFFLFILPWQTRLIIREGKLGGGYWEYGTIAIYASEIILWIAVLLWCADAVKKRKKFTWNAAWTVYILYLIILGLFALQKETHFYYLFMFAQGIFLYVLVKSADSLKASHAFLSGVFLQAILGIYQFFTQSTFANKWLGMAAHDPGTLGTFVVETINGRWLRAYGGLPHPNILGGYILIALLLLVDVLVRNYEGASKKEFSIKEKFLYLNRYLLLVIFSIALFLTFSRSAWLALIVGLFIQRLRSQEKRKIIVHGLLLIVFVFFVFGTIFREPLFARIESNNRLEKRSRVERLSGYTEARKLIKKYPLVGVGLGNYTYAMWKDLDAVRPSYVYQPAHNAFLLFIAETGLLGMLVPLYLCFKKRKYFLYIVPILMLGFFDHYLLSLYPGITLLFVAVALLGNRQPLIATSH